MPRQLPDLRVELAPGIRGLYALQAAWTELYLASPHRAFYNDWRWHVAIARHLVPEHLYYLQVLDADRLVAIVPLHAFTRAERGVTVRHLASPTHAHLTLSDVLVDGAYQRAGVLRAVVRWLQRQSVLRWHRLRFSRFSVRSNLHALCREYESATPVVGQSYYTAGPGAGTAAAVSGKQLRNARRLKSRALEQFGSVEAEVVHEHAQLADALEDFMRAEASGWKGDKMTAMATDAAIASFYREVVLAFGASGQARIVLLRLGRDIAAGQLLLTCDGTAYLLKIGYEQRFNDAGAGTVLLKDVLEGAAGRFDEINLITAPEWAERWHFDIEVVCTAGWYNATPAGLALRYAKRLSDNLFARDADKTGGRR